MVHEGTNVRANNVIGKDKFVTNLSVSKTRDFVEIIGSACGDTAKEELLGNTPP